MNIPMSESQVSPTTVTMPKQGMPNPVEAAFGGGVARAVEGLGETGSKIANALQNHIIERNNQQNIANRAAKENQFRLDLQNKTLDDTNETVKIDGKDVVRPAGWSLRKGYAAIGSTNDATKWYSENKRSYLSGMTDPNEIAKLSNEMDSHFISQRESIIKNESTEKIKSYVDTLEANSNLRTSSIVNAVGIEGINKELKGIEDNSKNIGSIKSWSPEETTVNANKQKKAALQNYIDHDLKLNGDIDRIDGIIEQSEVGEDLKTELKDFAQTKYQTLKTIAVRVQKEAQLKNRLDFLDGVSKGQIDPTDPEVINNVSINDPELGIVAQNMAQSGGKYRSTNDVLNSLALESVASGVMKSSTPEEANSFFIGVLKGKNGSSVSKDTLGVMVSIAKEHADAIKASATTQQKQDWSILKSSLNIVKSVAKFTPPGMVYTFLKARYDNQLQGEAIKKAARESIRQSVIDAHPELGKIPMVPNKIVNSDGTIDTIHEGNLGEYGDYTRDEE